MLSVGRGEIWASGARRRLETERRVLDHAQRLEVPQPLDESLPAGIGRRQHARLVSSGAGSRRRAARGAARCDSRRWPCRTRSRSAPRARDRSPAPRCSRHCSRHRCRLDLREQLPRARPRRSCATTRRATGVVSMSREIVCTSRVGSDDFAREPKPDERIVLTRKRRDEKVQHRPGTPSPPGRGTGRRRRRRRRPSPR